MRFLRVCPVCRGERRVLLGWSWTPAPVDRWLPLVELCSACDGEGLIRHETTPEDPCG